MHIKFEIAFSHPSAMIQNLLTAFPHTLLLNSEKNKQNENDIF